MKTALNSLPCNMPPPCSKDERLRGSCPSAIRRDQDAARRPRASRAWCRPRSRCRGPDTTARRGAKCPAPGPGSRRCSRWSARHARPAAAGKRRLATGKRKAALHAGDHGGFLAADVQARTGHDAKRHRAADRAARSPRTTDAVATAARAWRVAAEGERLMRVDVQDDVVRAGRQGRDERTFDHLMWRVFEKKAVLEGAGLVFVAVADDVFVAVMARRRPVPICDASRSRRRPCRANPLARSRRCIASGSFSAFASPSPPPLREPGVEVRADLDLVSQKHLVQLVHRRLTAPRRLRRTRAPEPRPASACRSKFA